MASGIPVSEYIRKKLELRKDAQKLPNFLPTPENWTAKQRIGGGVKGEAG